MRSKFASFTETEHRARLAQARRLLKEHGIDHCISVAPESLYYYGGYDSWVSANSPQALIFSADDDEPTIVLRDTDLSLAYESSWVEDVRSYRLMFDDVPGIFAAVAREKGLRGGKPSRSSPTRSRMRWASLWPARWHPPRSSMPPHCSACRG